jgi:hypothetical protein
MPKSLIVKRWIEWMKVDLNMFKKKSRSISSWNSIKNFEQGENEFEG